MKPLNSGIKSQIIADNISKLLKESIELFNGKTKAYNVTHPYNKKIK